MFYGRTQSYITAERGVRSKEELWCDIKVDVASGSRDIYAAIDGAFDAQKVHVDGEIAEQFGSISKLPPILQIQVQRVQFDPVKKTSYKSTHHLELKETIYLDRYMDTQQEELMNRRRQCWAWKDTLRVLEARREELLRKEVRYYTFSKKRCNLMTDCNHRRTIVKTCLLCLIMQNVCSKILTP